LMGAFLSALSSIWSFSVHGVGTLTSSVAPYGNGSCRMHLFAMLPIFDTGTPFHQSSISSSLLICRSTFFSSSFTRHSRMAAWLGNPFGIPRNSTNNPILDLLNPEFSSGFYFFDRKNVFPPILNKFPPIWNPSCH
jgi:hypothetical protein